MILVYASNDRIIKYSLTDKVDTSHIFTIGDITVGGEEEDMGCSWER